MRRPKIRVVPILVGFACLCGAGVASAQRGAVPRSLVAQRGAPGPRSEPPPREDRPAFLNASAASLLFSASRVEEIPPCSLDSPPDEGQRSALASLATPGLNLCVIESKPYGINGVSVFHFLATRDEPGPIRIEGNPELESWIGKAAGSYRAHKVHLDWGKVLAKRYSRMFTNINSPKIMLLNIVSTDLTMGALMLPPNLELTRAILDCSAFAVETAITGAAVQGSFGLASLVTLGGWVSSGYQCYNSLKPLFNGIGRDQQALEASRAEASSEGNADEDGARPGGGGPQGGHGDAPPRDHRGPGPDRPSRSSDRSPGHPGVTRPERAPERSKPERSQPERSKPERAPERSKPERPGTSRGRDIT